MGAAASFNFASSAGKEELIAEMGAAFLCGHADIVEWTINNSAASIHGWLEPLRQDKTLLVQASAQAQRAADLVLGQTGVESKPAESGDAKPLEPLEVAA